MGRGQHVGAASDFAAAGTSRHHYHSHNSFCTTMTDYNGEIMQGTVDETGVLHLVLNRAPVNAANAQLFFELGHYFSLAKGDPNVKAIVLSSASPKYFTAGLDLKASNLKQGGSDVAREALKIMHHVEDMQAYISQIEECQKPVIAAISGIAYGLAIDIASACDIRYCSSDAQFSIKCFCHLCMHCLIDHHAGGRHWPGCRYRYPSASPQNHRQ